MKLLLTAAAVLLSFALWAQPERYCNTEYGFCLEYPGHFSMLTAKGGAQAPALFVSEASQAQVEVSGHSNTDNWSLEDIYYFNFEDHLRRNADLEILEETFEEDAFEVLYQEDGQLHYFRILRQPGQYVKLSVALPASQEDALPALRQQLSIESPKP